MFACQSNVYSIESYSCNEVARFEAQCLFDEAWRCVFHEARRHRKEDGPICFTAMEPSETVGARDRGRFLSMDLLLALLPPDERRKALLGAPSMLTCAESRVLLGRIWRHQALLRRIQAAHDDPAADEGVPFLWDFARTLSGVAVMCCLSSRKLLRAAADLGLFPVEAPQDAAVGLRGTAHASPPPRQRAMAEILPAE